MSDKTDMDKFGGFRLQPGDTFTQIAERMPEPSRSLVLEQAHVHVRQARDRLPSNVTARSVALEAYLTGYFNATMQARRDSTRPNLVMPEEYKQ